MIVEERDSVFSYTLKNGFWFKAIYTVRHVRNMSIYGNSYHEVLCVRYESNLPKADHAAFRYCIRDLKFSEKPRRVSKYFQEV